MAEFPLATRFVHVVGMALLLGGSVAVWASLRWEPAGVDAAVARARRYEWLFWALVAAMIVTGVGNVGAFGDNVPGPGTVWGRTLTVKLAGVAGLLVGSIVRTSLVDRCDGLGDQRARRTAVGRLRVAYGATGLYLLGLVALAEALAHG